MIHNYDVVKGGPCPYYAVGCMDFCDLWTKLLSEVAMDTEVGTGLNLKWELTILSSTTQMGGVVPWPMSSTPRAGHVIW